MKQSVTDHWGITDTTAGVITNNVTTPREIQLGLHLNF